MKLNGSGMVMLILTNPLYNKMKLLDAQIGKTYIIESMEFCEPCDLMKPKCNVIGLMERGFMMGEEIVVKKIQGGLVIIGLLNGGGEYVLRIDNTNNIILKEGTPKSDL